MTSKLTRERLQEIINLACKTCSDGSVIYPKTYTTVDSKEIVELARVVLAAIDVEQVAQCPYPCGWDTLNKLAIQDAAFVALALVAGEPATESIRSAVISNNDRLLKVISFCRDVMPNAKPVVTQKECQKCKGTGIADSGGVQPWGEPISIECDCATSQSTAVIDIDELRLAFEAKERESDEGFNLHKYGIGYADDATQARWEQWLACRAAMLQAGNSPAQSDCCPAQNHVSPEQSGDTPAQSQGWIPVSEQMPPSRHEVLVGRWWGEMPRWCCKWATYIPGHPDALSSGWLIPGGSWTPTHWMELPAAPQEVKGE